MSLDSEMRELIRAIVRAEIQPLREEGCTLDGYYEVGAERTMCCVHAAIVLLARAVYEAVALENDPERSA